MCFTISRSKALIAQQKQRRYGYKVVYRRKGGFTSLVMDGRYRIGERTYCNDPKREHMSEPYSPHPRKAFQGIYVFTSEGAIRAKINVMCLDLGVRHAVIKVRLSGFRHVSVGGTAATYDSVVPVRVMKRKEIVR